MQKLFGHGSAIKKCHRCPITSRYSKNHRKNHYGGISDYQNWISYSADPETHRDHARKWLQCKSRSARDDYFKKHGVR